MTVKQTMVLVMILEVISAIGATPSSLASSSRQCLFCAADARGGATHFNLSRVPSTVFTLHSGTRGSLIDPWLTYYVTSPCGSVGSAPNDMCFGGSTADPFAQHYTGTTPDGRYGVAPICSGLGSLGGEPGPTVVYTPGVDSILNITLHGGTTEFCYGTASATYVMICDASVSADHAPDPVVTVHNNCSFVVTWRHPSICTAEPMGKTRFASDSPARESVTSMNLESAAGQSGRSSWAHGGCEGHIAPPAPPPVACEGCLPSWCATWDMKRSTMLYTCNSSGMHNVSEAVRYGVVSYDWSNGKALWANAQPMNADDLLTKQAELVLAADPGIPGEQPRVWVYRNKIKALNWFSSVREKLDDPQFAGWFVRFKNYRGRASNNSYHTPACDWFGNVTHPPKCSGFYHDLSQTPEHPGANRSVYRVDGACAAQCNCGPINPCAEYTFDHRNDSFSDWFINGYMINEQTLLHKPVPINIGWLDDEITLQGMSEGNPYPTFVADTGSTAEEMQDHVDAFRKNIAKLQKATVKNGGFYWQMITGRGPLIRPSVDRKGPHNVTAAKCAATLRQQYCVASPDVWRVAHLYQTWPTDPNIGEQATAEFLLTRGDYAWIGYSWSSCESTKTFPRPAQWDVDYGGKPSAPCVETGSNTGIFVRHYPKATVQWDCNLGEGKIIMKSQ